MATYAEVLDQLSDVTDRSPMAHAFLHYVKGLRTRNMTIALDDAWAACHAAEEILDLDLSLVETVYQRLRKTL
jgi:hypothetical protein